jgi:integrase/recombinase XerC
MPMNGERLLKRFLAGRPQLTALAYTKDLEDFQARLKAANVADAAARLFGVSHGRAQGMIGDYLASMKRRGLAPATINRRLATLRSLGKVARILGMIPWVLEAKNVRSERVRETKGPGRENVMQMIGHMTALPREKENLRDLAIVRLAYDLGLRRGEICSLNVADVTADGLKVRRKGKQGKQTLFIPKPTRTALDAWIAARTSQVGALFVNFDKIHKTKTGRRLTGSAVYSIVRGRAQKAGVKVPVRPHGIRHTAITDARVVAQRHGHGLDKLVDFSGHSEVRTLKLYLDREDSAQALIAGELAIP